MSLQRGEGPEGARPLRSAPSPAWQKGFTFRVLGVLTLPQNLADQALQASNFKFTFFPQLQFTSQDTCGCHPAGYSPRHTGLRTRLGTSGRPGRPVCPQRPSAARRSQQVRPQGSRGGRGVLGEAASLRSPPKDFKSCVLCRRLSFRIPLHRAGMREFART